MSPSPTVSKDPDVQAYDEIDQAQKDMADRDERERKIKRDRALSDYRRSPWWWMLTRRKLVREIALNGGTPPTPIWNGISRAAKNTKETIADYFGGVLALCVGLAVLAGFVWFVQSQVQADYRENAALSAQVSATIWSAEKLHKAKYGEYTTDLDALQKVVGPTGSAIIGDFDKDGMDTGEGLAIVLLDDDGRGFTVTVNDASYEEPSGLFSGRHPGLSWREGSTTAGGCTADSEVPCTNGRWDPREALLN